MNTILTKYEKTALIGKRAEELSHGAKPCTEIGNLVCPIKIAEKEYREGRIPLIIRTTLPDGRVITKRIRVKA